MLRSQTNANAHGIFQNARTLCDRDHNTVHMLEARAVPMQHYLLSELALNEQFEYVRRDGK
jgi:hypothetical protein